MFYEKQLPTRINRTDKILVSQEKTPDSIKRWKRCVIQPTQPLCVRDTYKTFLVYKALYYSSCREFSKRFRTKDYNRLNPDENIISINLDRNRDNHSHNRFVWRMHTKHFLYIKMFVKVFFPICWLLQRIFLLQIHMSIAIYIKSIYLKPYKVAKENKKSIKFVN